MISDEMISYIDQLFQKEQLFLEEPNPDVRQIEYRLRKFRDTDIKPMVNLGDLNEWCNANEVFPANKDDAFVLAFESSPIFDKLHFRFCLSTPALLEKFIGLKTICIDATYKLNWNGFPLVVLSTVDRRKKFHPLLYACMSHETTEDYTFVFETVKNSLEVLYEVSFQPTTDR